MKTQCRQKKKKKKQLCLRATLTAGESRKENFSAWFTSILNKIMYQRKKGNGCSVKKYIRNILFLDFCILVGEVRSECKWTVMIEKSLKPIAQLGEATDQGSWALNLCVFKWMRN